MKNTRRSFIGQILNVAGLAALNKPILAFCTNYKKNNGGFATNEESTVYYSCGLNGNVFPVHRDIGGVNQIQTLLTQINYDGLLLDGGNFLNSSADFRQQKEIINAMNKIGYQVSGIGSNELLNGEEYLTSLAPFMNFSLVNCNYQFTSALNNLVNPYVLKYSGNKKVGITGIGPKLSGIGYADAITCANSMATFLKVKERCDLVICISQLGDVKEARLPDNYALARQSEHIDMIIAGNTKKLSRGPFVAENKNKHEVFIGYAGAGGLTLGRTIFGFDHARKKNNISSKHFIPGISPEQKPAETYAQIRRVELELNLV